MVCVYLQSVTVQAQEYVGREEGNTFVPVDERVVHEKRLEQRGRHLGEVGVVTGLRAVQGAFQQAVITNTWWTSKPFQQGAVDCQHLVPAQEGNVITSQVACPVFRSRRWTALDVLIPPGARASWRHIPGSLQ